MGRHKTIISEEDMARAERYAFNGCQNGTICTLMGWDRQWLDGREDILTKLTLKRAERKNAIREAQTKGLKNPVMQVWLGKQELGQTDKSEIAGRDGAPLLPPQIIVMPPKEQ